MEIAAIAPLGRVSLLLFSLACPNRAFLGVSCFKVYFSPLYHTWPYAPINAILSEMLSLYSGCTIKGGRRESWSNEPAKMQKCISHPLLTVTKCFVYVCGHALGHFEESFLTAVEAARGFPLWQLWNPANGTAAAEPSS